MHCLYTCVDEASGSSLAELFGFIRQCDFHDPRDVSRRCLDTYCVRCDQLRTHQRNCVSQQQQKIPLYAL